MTGVQTCALPILVYAAATALKPQLPWLHYVGVAGEAAMVGAIADWFAVVALFHHPLNLRFIPHTAIIPRNKARIAGGLAEFIQQNFLSTAAIVARIEKLHPARTLCRWLLKPANAHALAGYATRLLAFGLTALDEERVRGFLLQTAAATLKRADVAAAAAQVLDVLTEDKRHHALLDESLSGLDELLAREDTHRYIAAEIAHNAPLLKMFSDLFQLKLDEKAALRIVEVAVRKIAEVRRDRDHDLRQRFDAFVERFIGRLKEDEATRRKVFEVRDRALASPALGNYLAGLWEEFRAWLAADLGRRPSTVHDKVAGMAQDFGRRDRKSVV